MEGKNLKLANLEGGKTYYIQLKLPQHNNPIWVQRWKGSAINVKDRTFQRDWDSFGDDATTLELRLATTEEREWLNYCIEKDKYISYEDFLKEYKPTYEKGKWYKYRDWYIKFEKDDGGYFQSSEEIDNNRIYRKVNSRFGKINSKEKVLLEDLKEIEPYLPKDHPDIQQKPETFVGRYFKALVENARCSNVIKNNYYLIEQEDDLYFRFYTEFSEDSLFCLDKSLSGIYELMPIGWTPSDVVPEYVECIAAYGKAKLNTIYKTLNNYEADKMFNLTWKQVLIDFKHLNINFKTSTKEAYDLQNSKQYPLVPEECYNTEIEVGDEVQIISGRLNWSIYKLNQCFTVEEIDKQSGGIFIKPKKGESTGVHINSVKVVKKANKTTTLDKKVDVSSPKVTNKITVPIINTTSRDKQVHINVDIKKDGVIVPLLTTTKKSIKNIQINNLKTLTI